MTRKRCIPFFIAGVYTLKLRFPFMILTQLSVNIYPRIFLVKMSSLWMPASVMKLFIPSGLIALGMDFVLHAPESWLWRILWYSKWLRSLWMFRINQFGQMRFPFLLVAVMNCCFFSSPSSHSAYKADLQIGNPCGFFFSKAGYLKRGGGLSVFASMCDFSMTVTKSFV